MADDQPRIFTRRDLLKGVGVIGAGAAVAPGELVASPAPARPAEPQGATLQRQREAYETLTASEADLLEAIVDQLIPADGHGPGALEARAVHYIDRALGGALADSLQAYRSGLAAFDRYCRQTRGAPFTALSRTDQYSVLIDMESGAATAAKTGFAGSSAAFFTMVRSHTLQGMFGDPYYGGNANFVGWDLIGYPGVRTMVTAAEQQQLETSGLAPNHRSAYDYDAFHKATARAAAPGGGTDAD